jgi:hypothetical protein
MSALTEQDQKRAIQVLLASLSEEKKSVACPYPDYHSFVDFIEARLMEMQPAECVVTNRFADGMYIRELFIPKNTVLVGEIHRYEHPYVVSSGHILIYTEQGFVNIKAPHTGITAPGTRRIGLALEDTIFTTFHATHLKSVTEILEYITIPHTNKFLN